MSQEGDLVAAVVPVVKGTPLVSWACPTLRDEDGKIKQLGCGGSWGPVLPARCPTCKGVLVVTQRLTEVAL